MPGRQLMVTERTVMNYLKELAKTGSSTRSGRESTIKYHIPPWKQTEDENCNV